METIDRRAFLANGVRVGLGLGAFLGLGACGGGHGGSGSPGSVTAQWWVISQPDLELNKKLMAEHKKDLGGASVDIRYITNAQFAQSLQLAKQSNQLPDVTANGLNLPIAQLVANGWFQPLDLPDAAEKYLNTLPLYEGIQKFDGKIYTFPIRGLTPNVIPWFHTDQMSQAGLDPTHPPATYDDFRTACKAIKAKFGGKPTGLMLGLKVASRNETQVELLAQAAGFEGLNGQLFKTGEFAYHSDPYVNAIDFLKSLSTDGYASGGVTVDVKQGQARWAAGETIFYFDGPWIPGNIRSSYPKLEGHYGVGTILVPDGSRQPTVYMKPPGGYYFIPKGAKHPDVANKILGLLASPEYLARQVEVTGNPAPVPEVMKNAKVDAVVQRNVANIVKSAFTAPVAVIGNPDISAVNAAIKPAQPSLGALVQGYFSGDVKDLRGALKKLSDASAKALDDAIAAAKGKGAKVSMDDYVFPNWKPGANFTPEMYKR